MNRLAIERQIKIVTALTEGCNIRATERMTNTHRDTIMRLGPSIGDGCARLHDRIMRNLNVDYIELDELWSFVGKKQRRLTHADGADKGDQYIFTARWTASTRRSSPTVSASATRITRAGFSTIFASAF